jgi:hypothetical protein
MARTTPDWEPESEEDYEVAASELKKRFAQWLGVVGIESRGDDGEAPIHYKWAYVDGHLTRWTRRDLDEVDGESACRRETASWLLVVTPSDTERHHLHFYNSALHRPDEIREILSHD